MKPSYIDTVENRQPEAGNSYQRESKQSLLAPVLLMRLSMFRALLYRLD
jgi:hypothetical protein